MKRIKNITEEERRDYLREIGLRLLRVEEERMDTVKRGGHEAYDAKVPGWLTYTRALLKTAIEELNFDELGALVSAFMRVTAEGSEAECLVTTGGSEAKCPGCGKAGVLPDGACPACGRVPGFPETDPDSPGNSGPKKERVN